MGFCTVRWCGKSSKTSNYKKHGITFHRYPKSPTMKSKWIDATHRGEVWYPSTTSVICSRHFTEDCFVKMTEKRRRLLNSAVPTLFLPVLGDYLTEGKEQQRDGEGPSTSAILDTTQQHSTSCMQHDPDLSTGKRICVCDSNTPAACDITVVKRLCRRIVELQSIVKQKNKKMRKLYDENRRLKEKNASLQALSELRSAK